MSASEIIPGLFRINLPIPRGGFESFLDGWLIKDTAAGQTVLFETGPANAVPELLKRLDELNVRKIDFLVYTHIHLDHAGGAGQFIKKFPDTMVLAPERGRKHLADPSKLAAGSRSSLGNLCDAYGTPVPLPVRNLMNSADAIKNLTVIDTPGHAPHHSSYVYDLSGRRILFPGETAGCWFRLEDGSCFMRPATPHKFYYDTELKSLGKLLELENIDMACFPHSGCTTDAHEIMTQAEKQLKLWLTIAEEMPPGAEPADMAARIEQEDPIMKKLDAMPQSEQDRERFFIKQSAAGFLGWVRRPVCPKITYV